MSPRYQFLAQTKKCFAFLESRGFQVESEYEGGYGSLASGFNITYASREVGVVVGYGAMDLEVIFKKGTISVDYLFLDHNLYANASGLAGPMFPLDKLAPVIDAVAQDIEMNYETVLRGDAAMWQRIEKLISAKREWKPYLP